MIFPLSVSRAMVNLKNAAAVGVCLIAAVCTGGVCLGQDTDFESMFNGENLLGWRVNENPASVYIQDGCIVTHGQRAHVFYVGPSGHASFTDFHFKSKVKTEPGANSGIYFHTRFESEGWPSWGYEAQVNNTQSDPKKTGGLYAVQDNFEAPVKDGEWFDYEIIVKKKHVLIKINGQTITDYTEPDDPKREPSMEKRLLDHGTIALQAHDPDSKVWYKDLSIKVLK